MRPTDRQLQGLTASTPGAWTSHARWARCAGTGLHRASPSAGRGRSMKTVRHVGWTLLAAWLALAWTLGPAAAKEAGVACPPAPVRIALPDFPAGEFIKGKGDGFESPNPGHLVRELRSVEQRLGCRLHLMRLPVVRMIREAGEGRYDLVAPAPEAMASAQGWVLPQVGDRTNLQLSLGQSTLSLFVARQRLQALRSAWLADGRPLGTVGVVAGSVAADVAKAEGWGVQTIQDFDKGMTMLLLQRVDHVFAPAISVTDSDPVRTGAVVALEPPVLPVTYFHAATPAFAQRHPDFLRAFWRAACEASRERRSDKPSCKP